jgi:DNA helicase-2/ATP-dependent DNA helicase PcrA
MGFLDIFNPLYEVDSWRTSFLDGKLPAARLFADEVLPLVTARRAKDQFAVARICKALSPLMTQDALRAAKDKQEHLKNVNAAIDGLLALWDAGADPTLLEVLRYIARTNLLSVPEILLPSARMESAAPLEDDELDQQTERAAAIEKFLSAPFSQVAAFASYMSGQAHFGTHQGVKGLEFDRVMVIMDDGEARGFQFKYEDLFGGKPGGDKTVEVTRRLFYVTCSRAKQSLALVAYTESPERIRQHVLSEGWFSSDEVICPQ